MSEYTEGPWIAAAKPSSIVGWPICSESGRVICNVASGGADANLIAAAPDLLEALEAAMDFINKHPADPDISDEQTQAWIRLREIDPSAAIAKARGE